MSISRAFAGCTRIESVIYCMGGAVYDQNSYFNQRMVNEHISFNLSQINSNDFSTFNPSQYTWNTLSNINNLTGNPIQPIAYSATTSLSSDNGYVFYGGLQYTNNNYTIPDYLFMQYNLNENYWHPLPALPNEKEISSGTIVNIGNDIIWKCGGQNITEGLNNTATLFDYTNSTWFNEIVDKSYYSVFPTAGHTATLAGNNVYKIGGSIFNLGKRDFFPMSLIYTFNTIEMKWTLTETKGIRPSDREYHTSTFLPDNNLILIYGGSMVLGNGISFAEDNYVIYNITSNSYIETKETEYYPYSKKRFGHYATLYNSSYLLLMLGNTENLKPADTINVLNITNPLHPIWIINSETTATVDKNENHGLNNTTLIIVIVIIVVATLSIIAGIFIYLRRKSQKKKERLRLEKEDPRKTLYDVSNDDIIKPYATLEYIDIIKPTENVNEKHILEPYEEIDISKPTENVNEKHILEPYGEIDISKPSEKMNEKHILEPYGEDDLLKPTENMNEKHILESYKGNDLSKTYDSLQINYIKLNESFLCKPHGSHYDEKTQEEETKESNSSSPMNIGSNTCLGTPIVDICKPSEIQKPS